MVHIPTGFPGNGETASSLTANPCFNRLKVDLSPAAHKV